MRAVGIIAEYNPFHSGHKYQINELKAENGFDCVVAVMSPCIVQRGVLALFPTSVRVRAALAAGVDLVIELPAPYAAMSAEGFARAGVELLNALGCVDTLAFGTEADSLKDILSTLSFMSYDKFNVLLAENLASGMEFAKARARAVQILSPQAAKILSTPNNVLGVEYCKAINSLNARLSAHAIKRCGAMHDDAININEQIQSASAMRQLLQQNKSELFFKAVPPECAPIYERAIKDGAIASDSAFEIAVLSRLRAMNINQLAQIRLTNEGLENRLENAVHNAKSLEELYSLLKCRRYSHARMRRLVLDAALGYDKNIPKDVPYLHILGATQKGLELVKCAKRLASKPISASLASLERESENARIVAKATDSAERLASLCYKAPQTCGTAYTTFMIKA